MLPACFKENPEDPLPENFEESLVSLYGEALDFAEKMKSRQLTSMHFLLAYFSVPSEAAVVFEERGTSYKEIVDCYNQMVKTARISGNSLKEPADTVKLLEENSLKRLLNKGQKVSPLHFLASMSSARNSIAYRILHKLDVLTDIRLATMKLIDEPTKKARERAEELKRESTRITPSIAKKEKTADKAETQESNLSGDEKNGESALSMFGRNLTALAKSGLIDPVYGRNREIESIVDILGRKKNNNPLIIGPAGTGKTAVVEAVSLKQTQGLLAGKEIWELNLSSLVGGTEYRGSLEKRISDLLEFVEKNSDRVVIFIDEIHLLFSSGNDVVANMLKPALSRGSFPLIGATTTSEFNRHIAKDPAMERRFTLVKIEEPKGEELYKIVIHASMTLGKYHGVEINNEDIVRSAINLSDRYISGKSQPDKVLSLLDTLGSVLKREKRQTPSIEDLISLVSDMTAIPVENLLVDTSRIIKTLPLVLDKSIVGQNSAKEKVTRLLARRFGNRVNGKPLASMIFAGPTGTGKTEMAKKLASFLFGHEERLVVFDMSEFQEQHSISKLIGAPPGYAGFEEGGKLTESFRREPYQLLLLDEIEKAHPKILSIFLQILEEGRITDTRGFIADMTESIVVMTTNLGADLFSVSRVGFGESNSVEVKDEEISNKIEQFLSPELLNRIDDVIVFKPFSESEFQTLAANCIDEIIYKTGIGEQCFVKLENRENAAAYIVDKMSSREKSMGARAVKRAVGRLFEGPLLELCYSKKEPDVSMNLKCSVSSDGFCFK